MNVSGVRGGLRSAVFSRYMRRARGHRQTVAKQGGHSEEIGSKPYKLDAHEKGTGDAPRKSGGT